MIELNIIKVEVSTKGLSKTLKYIFKTVQSIRKDYSARCHHVRTPHPSDQKQLAYYAEENVSSGVSITNSRGVGRHPSRAAANTTIAIKYLNPKMFR